MNTIRNQSIKLCLAGSLLLFFFFDHGVSAFATEIVLISCPDGLVVVSDKRQVPMRASNSRVIFDDRAKKVNAFAPFLIGRIGGAIEFDIEDSCGGIPNKKQEFIGGWFPTYARYAKSFKEQSFATPNLIGNLGDSLCSHFEMMAKEYNSPWHMLQTDFANQIMFVKASPHKNAVEVITLQFAAIDEGGIHRIRVKESALYRASRTNQLCKILGFCSKRSSPDGSSESRHASKVEAIRWAEGDILATNRSFPEMVGNTVDEYLVRYDGKIVKLNKNKRLCP